jgi:hypothetical protein
MRSFCGAFPLLPRRTEAAREFAKTVTGPKRIEYAEALKRQGITKESWFLRKTPQGDIVTVHFEADDVEKTFEAQAKSKAPLEIWFKQQVKSVTGIDLEQPSNETLPEEIFHT